MKNTIVILCLLLAVGARAQIRIEWEHSYGGSDWEQANSIRETSDGGFVAAGYSKSGDGDVSGNHGGEDYWVVKTDAEGNLQWEHNFGGSDNERAEDVRQTPDGGYIVAGYSRSADGDAGGNKGAWDCWVLKLDAAGNLQWEQNYGGSGTDAAYAVQLTADGGYIVAGNTQSIDGDVGGTNGGVDYWVLKLDASGNIQWEQNYGGSAQDAAYSIELTSDGGYVVAGASQSVNGDVGGNLGAQDYWIIRLNASGDLLWERNYGGSNADLANEIQRTSDGGYVVAGNSFSSDGDVAGNNGIDDCWIVKLDDSGNLQWGKVYGGISYDEAESIRQTTDGSFLVAGLTRTPEGNTGGTTIDNAWIFKTDPSGNLLWQKRYGGTGIEQAYSILQTTDNGFVFCGVSDLANGNVGGNQGGLDVWIVKISPLPGSIQGHVYLDNTENCIFESGDSLMAGIVLTVEDVATGNIFYGYTDPQGYFLIETDTTPCVLSYVLPSPYFGAAACSPNHIPVGLSGSNPNAGHDFYLKPVIGCPYLTVDIATPVLRRCFDAAYYLSYCNKGTVMAEDAYVEVSFAPEMVVTGASIPWSAVNGNTYTFQLGDLGVLECGQFTVSLSFADCDSTYLGQTICAQAHIFPDTYCGAGVNWNGAELRATATCIGSDSVKLQLQNVGTADMLEAVPFLVIEDIIMRDGGPIQLNSMGIATWTIPINGLTQRITAQQPANHPFKTFTTAAVNLCNTQDLPPLPGPVDDFFTVYPDDEEAPFIAIDCQQIIAAFDPNDKTVHPTGATQQGFVTPTTDLTYKIRFQNTGTDTAFTVVIIDTIDAHLDITTLREGASSHPYVLDIYGAGVLKFTFQDIRLPDSMVNEPASHGFVQFSVRQKAGNTIGTLIQNEANIYFDYNPPVATNTVLNTVGKIFLEGQVATNEVDGKKVDVLVFPNPAADRMSFAINDLAGGFDLLLFDVQGKQVQQISTTANNATLYRNSLPEGLYFFEIRAGGRPVASGRLVFK
ncbi:MAG: T9SS type A sorting domain-containing protein [Saprospiraceae bacterium]|nr:T9SS type A sorting domain-containing protein [Saprospiraceae bacterium]